MTLSYKMTPFHKPKFSGKIPIQNMFTSMLDCKVTLHFSGDNIYIFVRGHC
jgi:hypothetical protein